MSSESGSSDDFGEAPADPDRRELSIEPEPILLQVLPQGSRFRLARWLPRDAAIAVLLAIFVSGAGYVISSKIITAIPYAILIAIGAVLEFGVLLAFPLWMVRRRRDPKYLDARSKRSLFKEFLLAVPATIGVLICVVMTAACAQFVLTAVGHSVETPQEFWGQKSPGALVAIAVLAVTMAPLVEEIFFRGYLYNSLRSVFPTWLAMIAQAFLFGLGHVYEPLGVVVTFVIGLALAMVYEWRKTLVAPVFVHCMWNTFVAVVVAITIWPSVVNAPMIGVTFSPQATGQAVVDQILPGSPAEQADIRPGDVILTYDGIDVTDNTQIIRLVRKAKVGDQVSLEILRGEERMRKRVTLRSRADVE
jgi:uncharacterized protein